MPTTVLGAADLAADLASDLTRDATELLYARSRIVIATRAAGLAPPIDGAWLWLDDTDGLEADSARSRQLGFKGRIALHPNQVEPELRAYSSLAAQDVSQVRNIVEEFEKAERNGVASIRVNAATKPGKTLQPAARPRHRAMTRRLPTPLISERSERFFTF